MVLSAEALYELRPAIERRAAEIHEIERLWTLICRAEKRPVIFADLDRDINLYFDSIYGRDSLGFESMAEYTDHLRQRLGAEISPVPEPQRQDADSLIVALYADGGVIRKNPSDIGGTWAWCGVDAAGNRVIERSGAFPAPDSRPVSNNHTEQIAITLALEAMPDGWSGSVYSDSQIALGRVFKNWRETNLPANISQRSAKAVKRLGKIQTVLLQGHPTKGDLELGIGKKRNLPVSIHNVWCDKACSAAAKEFLAQMEKVDA